jgi:hypothetical protein
MGFRGWVLLVVAGMLVFSGCLVNPVSPASEEPDRRLRNIPREDPAAVSSADGVSDRPLDPSVFDRPNHVPNRSLDRTEEFPIDDRPRPVPIRDSHVVVGVENDVTVERNVTAMVDSAVSYWERHADRYVNYSIDFVVVPDAEDPDVLVTFQETVECRGTTGWLGCAPDVESVHDTSETMVVAIKSGYTNESTIRTIKHEFGHVLGLDHGQEPMPLMSPRQESLTLERPNVDGRTFPWRDRNLSVYVDYRSIPPDRQAEAAQQVSHALEYYHEYEDSSRWKNVSFVATSNREAADILIDFEAESSLLQGAGSIGQPKGPDTDGDGQVEYYTESRIVVSNVQVNAIGWHVGYWLGVSLGAGDASELPDPFRNGTRTGEWWRTTGAGPE